MKRTRKPTKTAPRTPKGTPRKPSRPAASGKAKRAVQAPKAPPRAAMAKAFADWKAGRALAQIAREFGVRRRVVKVAFRALAGGKEALAKLRAAGAGCHVAFGGKRAVPKGGTSPAAALRAAVDDRKVPHVSYAERVKHWTSRREPLSKGEYLAISISPKGVEYVQAKPTERADLIFDWKKDGWDYTALGVLRMRLFETSSAARKLRKEAKLVKKGEKLLKVRKTVKRARKLARHAIKDGAVPTTTLPARKKQQRRSKGGR